MPQTTKAQLQKEIGKLRGDNAGLMGRIVELNSDLFTESLRSAKAEQENIKLRSELNKLRSEFAAYRVGSSEFSRNAEEEITRQAIENNELRIKLVHSKTKTVYAEANAALVG